jgi:antitoxin VapB
MALFVKDMEVDRMAGRLAALSRISKTEAVRRALRHELERHADQPGLVERGVAFTRALRARAGKDQGVADKSFIDELYGEH